MRIFDVSYVCITESECRLDEQLQDVSSVRTELKDKRVKVSELEASSLNDLKICSWRLKEEAKTNTHHCTLSP